MTKLVNEVIIDKLVKPGYEFSKSHQNKSAFVLLAMVATCIAHTIFFYSRKNSAPIRIVEQLCSSKLIGDQFTVLASEPDGKYYLFRKNQTTVFDSDVLAEESFRTLNLGPSFIPLEKILPISVS